MSTNCSRALRVLCCLLLAALLPVLSFPGECAAESVEPSGRERILLFDSQAEFAADGTMTVTESIRFLVHGENIKRGFIRDLPLSWTRADNKRFRLNITVLDIQRQGEPEPYVVSQGSDILSIRIGDAGKLVPQGVQEYRIRYAISNHFSRFPDWDELYWNVTGNDWEFSMDAVRFSLRFSPELAERVGQATTPENVAREAGLPPPWLSIDAYTGRRGEQGKKAEVLPDGSIVTTSALRKGEGLTIAYTWPRSILGDAPDPEEDHPLLRALLPTTKQPESFAYWLVPLLAAVYFMRAWGKMRPDGARTTVVPLFSPPDGLSPGRLRYALCKRYDFTAFSADLLQLVAKGGVTVLPDEEAEKERPFFIRLLRPRPLRIARSPGQGLGREESHTLKTLFTDGTVLDVSKPRQKSVQKAFAYRERKALEDRKLLFTPYRGRLAKGLSIFFVFSALLCVFRPFEDAFVITLLSIFLAIFFGALGTVTGLHLKSLRSISNLWELIPKLLGLAFLAPFWAGLGVFFYHVAPIVGLQLMPDGFAGAVAVFFLVVLAAIYTAPDRTREGLERQAVAKGLKMYLGTAEKRRFEFMYPPEESIGHFEKLLPYALALGVGKTWANRFNEYLERSGESTEHFSDLHSWDRISRFSGASASAARSQKSSSGSSSGFSGSGSRGGGSSGGGSGGGGGRGW